MSARLTPLLLFLSFFAAATELSAETPESKARDLLLQSYSLSQGYSASERAYLLGDQAGVASRLDEGLAKQWAEELFDAAKELPNTKRQFAYLRALDVMAGVEPMRAYEMARSVGQDPQSGEVGQLGPLISQIANGLWRKQGEAGFLPFRSMLGELAGSEDYPYAGVTDWIASLCKKNPQAAQMLLSDALASYLIAPEKAPGFIRLLGMTLRGMAAEVARQALGSTVNQLLADDADKPDFYGIVTRADKSSVIFRKPSSVALIHLVLSMRDFDPALLERVAASRPEVRLIARGETFTLQTATGNSGEYRSQTERHGTEPDFNNPDRKLAVARQIQDPFVRASALIDTAQLPSTDAKRGREALAEATGLIPQIKDDEAVLAVLASIAEAAKRQGDDALVVSTGERGLALAQKLCKTPEKWPGAELSLGRLAAATAQVNPNAVLVHLGDYKNPLMRARLLVNTASGLVSVIEEKRRQEARERAIRQWRGSHAQ